VGGYTAHTLYCNDAPAQKEKQKKRLIGAHAATLK